MALERFYRDKEAVLPTPEDFTPASSKIAEALEFAKEAHRGQFRKTGEPFYHHPMAVAQIITEEWELKDDEDLIVAALLHDVPEDNESVSLYAVSGRFGAKVASLVDGVTKVDRQTVPDADRKTIKKVSAMSYLEPKVALIKIADRLHNMRTLQGMPPEKQIEKSTETLDIYAPMAESLGLWSAKKELEDLSFRYLHPEIYEAIKQEVDSDPRLKPNFLTHTTSILQNLLAEKGIKGEVLTRVNGYWSLHRKREKALVNGTTSTDRGFLDINDLVSFRVLTENLDDCYRMLGFTHDHPEFRQHIDYDRFDEFVGENRRINGYSAIQTTLDLPQGATEIAFATAEMERFNRKGVISLLADGKVNLEDYTLKSVFSPEGRIMFLPKAATGVDYVYAVSQRLGANARGIIVDGEEMPPTMIIPNSSTVDVVIGEPRRAPEPDFLNYCLPATRAIIEEQLNMAASDQLVSKGRELAEDILESRGLLRLEDLGPTANELIFDYGGEDIRDIYSKLGNSSITANHINTWLDEHGLTKQAMGTSSIKIGGPDRAGILFDLSKWIFDEGGNITVIEQKTEIDRFAVLLVVKGLNSEGEDLIRAKIAEDPTFETWKVV